MTPEERRAQYMRVWRATNPGARQVNELANKARRSAQVRLAHLHPDEFTELLDEEREKRGLPPLGVKRPGP